MDYLYFLIGGISFLVGVIVSKIIQKIRTKTDGAIIIYNDEDGPALILEIPNKKVLKKNKIILDISQKNQ
jgi:hypothetical protein